MADHGHHPFPKPPKGYRAGEPTIRVEQSFYPKVEELKTSGKPALSKPKPMDVRIVSMRGAIRRRLMGHRGK